MYVRWKKRQLTSGTAPEDLVGDGEFTFLRVRLPDGSIKLWQAGLRVGDAYYTGRRRTMIEVRNIGKRGRKLAGDVPRVSYHAQLVESRRVNGKPRQHVIAYLGSYQEGYQDKLYARLYFWWEVDQRLATLDVSDADKVRIQAALAQRLAPPTDDERAQDAWTTHMIALYTAKRAEAEVVPPAS